MPTIRGTVVYKYDRAGIGKPIWRGIYLKLVKVEVLQKPIEMYCPMCEERIRTVHGFPKIIEVPGHPVIIGKSPYDSNEIGILVKKNNYLFLPVNNHDPPTVGSNIMLIHKQKIIASAIIEAVVWFITERLRRNVPYLQKILDAGYVPGIMAQGDLEYQKFMEDYINDGSTAGTSPQ